MPLKKKYKFRNRIILGVILAITVTLMFYSPNRPNIEGPTVLEYELH